MTELTFSSADWTMDAAGTWLRIKADVPYKAQMFLEHMIPGKKYVAEIKEFRKKRSLDSNNYFWQLCDQIAEKLGRTKEDLYVEYIKEVGVFKDFHLSRDEAATFRTAWSMLGTGWPTEEVDYQQDGDNLVIRAYYGSSRYNAKQMGRIIDRAVEDAKDLGIETLTPAELARMNLEWGESCTGRRGPLASRRRSNRPYGSATAGAASSAGDRAIRGAITFLGLRAVLGGLRTS